MVGLRTLDRRAVGVGLVEWYVGEDLLGIVIGTLSVSIVVDGERWAESGGGMAMIGPFQIFKIWARDRSCLKTLNLGDLWDATGR